jgi:hypothetical protein
MAVAIIVAIATIQSTQASIDFWLEKPAMLQQGVNSIKIHAKNGGGMDGDFILVVRFTNALFDEQTEMPYTSGSDGKIVTIKYVLHKEDDIEKTIYFSINCTEPVSITLGLQQASLLGFIKANRFYPTQLTYNWDESGNAFRCSYAQ